MDWKKITHLFYWIFKARGSGVKIKKADHRNFDIGALWGLLPGYKPKAQRSNNKVLSIKDQGSFNTCVFNGSCVSKEPDEGCQLRVRSMVAYARRKGWLSGNGWTALETGMKVLQNFGVEEKPLNPESYRNWDEYSKISLNTANAAKHRIQSFWQLHTRSQRLKALDDGRIIGVAIPWRTGFNQKGGFKAPWLITKNVGYGVGGHFFVIENYILNYYGHKVYECVNSYGKKWGDKGRFYISMDYLDKVAYGFLIHKDEEDRELAEFLIKNDGKNVRLSDDPAIYHIQAGKKKLYPNWSTYLAWNQFEKGFDLVDKELLDRVEVGDNMDIEKTIYWPYLQHLKNKDVLDELLSILHKKD